MKMNAPKRKVIFERLLRRIFKGRYEQNKIKNAGSFTVTLLQPVCVTPGRSGPLGLVFAPTLLWPLSKCAAHHFDCHRIRLAP